MAIDCNEMAPTPPTVTATDNCDTDVTVLFAETSNPGACPNSYTLIRTWTATDNCGNATSFTQTISVGDSAAPVISGVPGDITAECDEAPAPATPTVSDDCDNNVELVYTEDIQPGTCPDNYTIIRTWTATDDCGNQSVATQSVTILDTTAPVFTSTANDITLSCADDLGAANGTATDNCDNDVEITFTEVTTAGACEDSYILTRTWIATDNCGNQATQVQTITVNDTEGPTLSGIPADMTVGCDGIPGANTANPTAVDNCDTNVDINFNETIEAGACADNYTIIRTWTATDNCGNQAVGVQRIEVGDNTPPVLIGVPDDAVVSCDNAGIDTPATVTATDDCSANVAVNFSENIVAGDCPDTYSIVRTWTASDDCGNQAAATQTITVGDNAAPVLNGIPADAIVSCESIPAAGNPTATDDCDNDVSIVLDEVIADGDCPHSYSIIRTWTATDNCGNATAGTQTVTVEDNTPPVLTNVPADMNAGCDGAGMSDPNMVTATDNCDNNVTIDFSTETIPGACPDAMTIIRTWTATDACGNASVATQTVTIGDTEAPVITAVPADETVECDNIPAPVTPVVTDDCDDNVTVEFVEDIASGACDNAYTITRTWTATDNCGNVRTAMQVITVQDTAIPVFASFPADVTIDLSAGETIPVVPNLTATDNCDDTVVVAYEEQETPGDCNGYTIVRTWVATDNCGNFAIHNQVITVIDELSISIVPANPSICAGGSIPFSVTGAPAGSTYTWSATGGSFDNSNSATPTYTMMTAGTYTITVNVNSGACSGAASTTVTVGGGLAANPVVTNGTCEVPGSIVLNVTGGTGVYTYDWADLPGNNDPADRFNIGAGTYSVTITDGAGCTLVLDNLTITEACCDVNAWLEYVNDAECDSSNGVAVFAPSEFDYQWSDGGTGSVRDDLAPGTYTVTVTDAAGCQGIYTVTIGQDECECVPPVVSGLTTMGASCGESNGAAEVLVDGALSDYEYLWHPNTGVANDDGNVRTELLPGMYTVSVVDPNFDGCFATIDFVVESVDGPEATVTTTPAMCDMANGSATLLPDNYMYIWMLDDVEGNYRDNLSAGEYVVMVMDPTSPECPSLISVVIESENNLEASAQVVNQPACGESNGSVTINVTGGASYTYAWSDGGTGATRSDLTAGLYNVIVTSELGCETTVVFTLTNNVAGATITMDDFIYLSCAGSGDGQANYGYEVAPDFILPATDLIRDINGDVVMNGSLSGGAYCINIVDGNGCLAAEYCFNVIEPNPLSVNVNMTEATCDAGGTISVDVAGGTGNYTYDWADLNGVAETEVRAGLAAGSYDVTITDENGCQIDATNIIIIDTCNEVCTAEAGTMTANAAEVCFENGNATVSATANGDAVVPTGFTQVYVLTRFEGGTLILEQISLNPEFNVPETGVYFIHSFVFNEADFPGGFISVTPGVSPVSDATDFLEANPDICAELDLQGAMTAVENCDNNGGGGEACGLEAAVTMDAAATCGNADGAATITTNGNYSIIWNDGATDAVRTDLAAGIYTIGVMANDTCFTNLTIAIMDDCGGNTGGGTTCDIDASVTMDAAATCGNADGAATVTTNGTYAIIWGDGVTGASRTDLAAGTYSIAVVANDTCFTNLSLEITDDCGGNNGGGETCGIEASVTIDAAATCDNADGAATITTNGNYSILWNDGSTDAIRTDLAAGLYTIDVVANDTCATNLTIVITDDCGDNNGGGADCDLDASVEMEAAATCGNADGAASVTANGAYDIIWSDGATGYVRTDLAAGTYNIAVIANDTCFTNLTVEITDDCGGNNGGGTTCDLEASVIMDAAATCDNADGAATITTNGNYSILWNDGSTDAIRTDLAAGLYTIDVIANDTCATNLTIVITDDCGDNNGGGADCGLDASVTMDAAATCDNADGAATVTTNGAYDIIWSDGATGYVRTDLAAGIYNIAVVANDTCFTNLSLEITDDCGGNNGGGATCDLEASVIMEAAATCDNADGAATITTNGNYSILWNDGSTDAIRTDLAAGLYTIDVIANDTCATNLTIVITDDCGDNNGGGADCGLEASVAMDAAATCDNADGSATVTTNGNYDIIWSDGATGAIRTDLAAGIYNIAVVANDTCFTNLSLEITDDCTGSECGIEATIDLDAEASCGMADGAATVTMNGDYDVLWSDGSTEAVRTDLAAGQYLVDVIANDTCSWTFDFIMTEDCSDCDGTTTSITLETTDCDAGATYCLEVPLNEIFDYNIMSNDTIYDNGYAGCNDQIEMLYDYLLIPFTGAVGPYMLEDWQVNGESLSGEFDTMDDLITMMNDFDPAGNWELDETTTSIKGGTTDNTYGEIFVSHPATGSVGTLLLNTLSVPGGTELTFAEGSHTVIITSNDTGCSDTLLIDVVCIGINTSETLVLMPGETDTLCVSSDIVSVNNLCPDSSEGNATYEQIDDNCFVFTGVSAGQDEFCLEICYGNDICDTLNVTTNIIELVSPLSTTDTLNLTIGLDDDAQEFCPDVTGLNGDIVAMFNDCADESGDFVEFTLNDTTGCVTYDAIAAEGVDQACIVICDSDGVCATTILIVTAVEEVLNTPPVAMDDFITTAENTTLEIDVLENDSLKSTMVSFGFISDPMFGTVELSDDNTFIYTAENGSCGEEDMFIYYIANSYGMDTATVHINIACEDINIYTGFSPNSDGVNDVFTIRGIENYPDNELSIYNRWGNMVYAKEGYSNEWGGDWEGNPLPDGTYFYVLTDGKGNTYSGYIQIHR